jgi:hypothetical protein
MSYIYSVRLLLDQHNLSLLPIFFEWMVSANTGSLDEEEKYQSA